MANLRIFKSEGWLVAEIPSLHVVTRARTLKDLEKNLKEAVALAVEGLMEVRRLKLRKINTLKIKA